jgi:serine protease
VRPGPPGPPPGAGEAVPDQIIVKFATGTPTEAMTALHRAQGAAVKREVPNAFVVLKVPAGTADQEVAAYRKNPNVEWAEPDYIAYALASVNDTYFNYQWNFFDYGTPSGSAVSNFGIQAPSAWDKSTGSGIVVAVLDTGVAYEDYAGSPGEPFAPYYRAPDLAGTAFVPGYDFVNGDIHPNDDQAHGTHVTGTIAQTTNNSYGVAGIAYACQIMPVKVLDSSGSGSYSDIASGIYWAVDHGAKVCNMSFGGSFTSLALLQAVSYAQSKDVLLVASAGNSGGGSVLYPARAPWCIAVGATRFDGQRASYSSYGRDLDLVAPGGDVGVDQNGDGYGDGVLQQTFAASQPGNFGLWFYSGTSMAAPHVTAAAALVWAANPTFTASQVRSALESTAKDLGAAGRDNYYGYGLVNAAAAIGAPPPPPPPSDTQPPVVTITNPTAGATVSGTVTVRATATDNVGVTSVSYRIDGGASVPMTKVATDTYEASWNTTTAANGPHTILVEAKDAAGNAGSNQVSVTVSNGAPPASTMHVGAIDMFLSVRSGYSSALASVLIVDSAGKPVSGATVSGQWSGLTSDSDTRVTSSAGRVYVSSDLVTGVKGTFTFTVTSVTHPSYTYDPSANKETSDSISTP